MSERANPASSGWRIAVPAPGSFLLSPCANFNAVACCAPVLEIAQGRKG